MEPGLLVASSAQILKATGDKYHKKRQYTCEGERGIEREIRTDRRSGGESDPNQGMFSYGFVRSCVRPRGLVAKWNDISEGIRRFSFFLSAEPSLFP